MSHINVAIDGPAGAGKSTIARLLSQNMGYKYVDTGAMYRTIGLGLLRMGIDSDDEVRICSAVPELDVNVEFLDGEQHVYLNGEDVTGLIRTEEVGNMASICSAYGPVRDALIGMQQEIGRKYPVVMDGRDIGTVVLPDAQVKIYLTASPEERANRRYKELCKKGEECDYDEVLQDIIDRDYRDMHREIAPLRKAEDAIEVDTDQLGIEEVLARICEIIAERS